MALSRSTGESYAPKPQKHYPTFEQEATKAFADIFSILYDLVLRVNQLKPKDEGDISGQRVDWRMEKTAQEGMLKWTNKAGQIG